MCVYIYTYVHTYIRTYIHTIDLGLKRSILSYVSYWRASQKEKVKIEEEERKQRFQLKLEERRTMVELLKKHLI